MIITKTIAMRSKLFIAILLLSSSFCKAQKNEWQVYAGSGVFFMSGKSIDKTRIEFIRPAPNDAPMNVSKHYGNKPGIAVSAGVSFNHIFKQNWQVGIAAGYQHISSNGDIDSLDIVSQIGHGGYATNGEFKFKAGSIVINPLFGKRLIKGKQTFTITAGPEFVFFLDNSETVKYRTSFPDEERNYKNKLEKTTSDTRIKIAFGWQINKIGIDISYAKGVKSFYDDYYGESDLYSNLIGINFKYRL
ncbi:MAG TPA: hypothetical protein VHM26_18585 [Chitinophagaceae bacterium]|jgi:hypothetical protein|nr:hypothetical protein [Chitinophagaceae bacterium]